MIGRDTEARVAGVLAGRESMVHRGPDDSGLWTYGEGTLGFRRLAILDLSPAGHQPMVDRQHGVGLVFNGEIYNYLELRKQLEAEREFRSQSDTEVLLNGFLVWGWEKLLDRIDGMFAFAIWDGRERTLYAARDRAGKKPLYFCWRNAALCFSSTPQGILSMLDRTPEIDPHALDAYLTYQAVPAPMTMYAGVRHLEPGHSLVFQARKQRLSTQPYWNIRYVPKLRLDEREILESTEELIRKAVRKRLRSDVPLGAFLSGGVDSSLVVALMAQELTSRVEAVVVGFADERFDERPFARKVAERWDVRLHEQVMPSSGLECLPEIVWQYGQPHADVSIVPTYHVAQAARDHATVVLNGDGGDELFGGYSRPVLARAAVPYRKALPLALRRAIDRLLPRAEGGLLRKLKLLSAVGARAGADGFRYDRGFGDVREEFYDPALLERAGSEHPNTLYSNVWDEAGAADDIDRVLRLDYKTYLPDQLLTKMDVSTMAHSIEARSPLLDWPLTEHAARIPNDLRIKGNTTKYLLKRIAARHVPAEVVYRRKRGFVMPAAKWMRSDLLPVLRWLLESKLFESRQVIRPTAVQRMITEHLSQRRDWSQQLWTLLVLEIWMRLYIDKTLDRSAPLESIGGTRVCAAASA